jgi:hypothetical protein
VQVLNYDERATFFFGIKEQLYYSGSVSNDMITRASREVASAYVNDSMVDSDRYATLKPVSDFHIATSANNILSNEIKLDATFSSAVSIRYFDDTPDLEDYSTNEDFKWYEMQLDDNLLPTAIRSSELIKLGVDHMDMAWRYGQAALRKSAEQMYSGRITVIGNPYIKAGDFMFIHDDTRKMTGVIKVRECIHHFNSANGFVTEITPGLYVEEAMFTFSTLMTKLTSVYANIVSRMHTDTIYSYMPKNKFMQTKMLYELATNQFGASNKSELDYLSKILIFGGSFLGLGWPTEMVLGRFTTLTMAERAAGFTKILAATGADVARIVHGSAELAMKIGKYAINNTPIKDLAAVSKAAVSSIRNVKSASELAALAKNAFNGAKGFGYMAAKLKSFVSVARSSNMLAVAALNPASLLFGIAFGVVLSFAFDTIDEIGATRQPIRMFPLTTNGRPFVAGIAGMRDNTYWESKIEEFGKTLRAGEKTAGFVSEMFFGDQSPIGETARDILAYQTTRLKEGL